MPSRPPTLSPSAADAHSCAARSVLFPISPVLAWCVCVCGGGGVKDLEVWKYVGGCGRVKVGGGGYRDVEGEPGEGWLGGVQGC